MAWRQSWHEHGVMKRASEHLGASTEYVLTNTLPQIAIKDGIVMGRAPLNFTVPLSCISTRLYAEAQEIVKRQKTDVIAEWDAAHSAFVHYVRSTRDTHTKLSLSMIRR